ncbi:polysaccharide biosynthesis tyrosine autokinase [Clostridium estertheticum]|uniref:polysaccharide biosynthesis tyrosine autokinase n=1 Tax=Clostridium estertheticum TaxID=238834 RepID=UPI001C0D2E6B|nr:polysaccharide biosynthesis tyrosine autokinase [Clostridium estertheticum]MBU3200982.1 polysaccharide biosynthesis tyrosine autokinase [Clostridium estertheticum]WAG63404.1 polysaccharide biosynthesis tyrosine autokinase [Clostridium estertheticum]
MKGCIMEEENYINIKDFLKIIRKRIKLIVLITVFATIITGIVSFYVLKPVYEAKCTVIVGKDSTDKITASEVTMYQDLIQTYSQIAKSRVVAENALGRLNLGVSWEEFMSNVDITPETGTQIVDISYKNQNTEVAEQGANALSQAFIEESQKLLPSGSVKIMDKALTTEAPIKPNKMLNIFIAFILGLIFSASLVFFIDYLDNTIKNEEDVERKLGLPTMGLIPKQNKMENLIVEKQPKSAVTEAFKSMRTNLLFSMENRGINTLMVSSSIPKEGKTSVSTNVAFAIAKAGKRVLLVDCDLRKPNVHRCFNISNNEGLADIILKERKVEESIIKINDNFNVITAGIVNYNSSELLSSQKMQNFINDMEKEYDYVILDTPPIVAFTDALTLVTDKIGVILVISCEQTKIEICKKSKQLLTNVNATLIGAVLNKVDKRVFVGYGYDYYSNGKKKKNKVKTKRKFKESDKGAII